MRFRHKSTDRKRLLRHCPTRRLGTGCLSNQMPSQPVVRSGTSTGVSLQLVVALAVAVVVLAGKTAGAIAVSNTMRSAEHDQTARNQLLVESLPPVLLEDLGSRLPVCSMDHELTRGYYIRNSSFTSVYWNRRSDATTTGDSDTLRRSDVVERGRVGTTGNSGFCGVNGSSSSGGGGGNSNGEVGDDYYSSGCRVDIGPPVPIHREQQFAWISLTNYVQWHVTNEREADLERLPPQPRCRVFITRQRIGAPRAASAAAAEMEAAGVVELPRQSSPLPPPFIWAAAASRLLLLGRSCDGFGGVDSGRFRLPRGLHVSVGLLRGLSACHVARVGVPATLNHRWAALIAQDPRYDALLLPHHEPCLAGVNYTLRVEPVGSSDGQSRGRPHDVDDIYYDNDFTTRRPHDLNIQVTVVPHASSCRRLCLDGHCLVTGGMQLLARNGALNPVTVRYEALSPASSGCDPEAFVGFVIMVRTHSRIVVVT